MELLRVVNVAGACRSGSSGGNGYGGGIVLEIQNSDVGHIPVEIVITVVIMLELLVVVNVAGSCRNSNDNGSGG